MNAGPTVAIVQARMTSTRLPGKPLARLAGKPMLVQVLNRLKHVDGVDEFVVAIPEGSEHDSIVDCVGSIEDVAIVRGSDEDVLERTADAVRATGAAVVLRVTSDCPMVDPGVSAAVLAAYRSSRVAYARLAFNRGFPLGFDTEVFSAKDLLVAELEATDSYEREHVTPFIWRRPDRFPAIYLDNYPDRRHFRLVVDAPPDLKFAQAVYDELYPKNPAFDFASLIALFERRPDLLEINRDVRQTPYLGVPNDQ